MGWAAGSKVADKIWEGVKDHIPDNKKPEVATAIIDALVAHDWDTLDESEELIEWSPKWRKIFEEDEDPID